MANYDSYEVKEGGVLEHVEGLCRHLTQGGSFTDSTPVTLSDVERYIQSSYYWILGELARNGYGTDISVAKVKGVLQELQALDAAVQVEFSIPITASGESNDRYRSLIARRDKMVNALLDSGALQTMGASRDIDKSKYLEGTGRDRDRKRTVYQSTAIPQPRFPRGFGQRPETPARSGTETSGGADPSLT